MRMRYNRSGNQKGDERPAFERIVLLSVLPNRTDGVFSGLG
jgi:hypothetical protein